MTVARKPLTKHEFAYLAVEQGGLCGCGCGRPLEFFSKGAIRDEHLHQLSLGGTNELDNRSLWIVGCSMRKDALDAGRRAKVRSLTKATRKSQKPKAKIQSHVNGLQGRGFAKAPAGYSAWGKSKPRVRYDD